MSAPAAARAPHQNAALRQRHDALGAANHTRLARAQLKRELRAGRLTIAEVTARRPEPLRELTLFALLGELPGIGQRRLERLNRRAIAARVNLARTLADASAATLRWLVAELDRTEPEGEPRDDDVAPRRARAERDWRSLALALDRLICDHERSIRDESLPAERWVWADERLHDARATLMRRQP